MAWRMGLARPSADEQELAGGIHLRGSPPFGRTLSANPRQSAGAMVKSPIRGLVPRPPVHLEADNGPVGAGWGLAAR